MANNRNGHHQIKKISDLIDRGFKLKDGLDTLAENFNTRAEVVFLGMDSFRHGHPGIPVPPEMLQKALLDELKLVRDMLSTFEIDQIIKAEFQWETPSPDEIRVDDGGGLGTSL